MSRTFFRWLLAPPEEPALAADVVVWWERRRLAYNVIVGAVGAICFVVYWISVASSGVAQEGDDIVEPMALAILAVAAVIGINICYTLGWIVDAPLRHFVPTL